MLNVVLYFQGRMRRNIEPARRNEHVTRYLMANLFSGKPIKRKANNTQNYEGYYPASSK